MLTCHFDDWIEELAVYLDRGLFGVGFDIGMDDSGQFCIVLVDWRKGFARNLEWN